MKCRIETRYLWEIPTSAADRGNAGQIVRLVHWSKRAQLAEARLQPCGHKNGAIALWTAMYNPVTDCSQTRSRRMLLDRIQQQFQRCFVIGDIFGLIEQFGAASVDCMEAAVPEANAIDRSGPKA